MLGENHQAEIIKLTDNDRIINKSIDNTNRTNKHPAKKAKRYANKQINVKPNLKILYTNADQFPNKNDDLGMFIADKDPDILLLLTLRNARFCMLAKITHISHILWKVGNWNKRYPKKISE